MECLTRCEYWCPIHVCLEYNIYFKVFMLHASMVLYAATILDIPLSYLIQKKMYFWEKKIFLKIQNLGEICSKKDRKKLSLNFLIATKSLCFFSTKKKSLDQSKSNPYMILFVSKPSRMYLASQGTFKVYLSPLRMDCHSYIYLSSTHLDII